MPPRFATPVKRETLRGTERGASPQTQGDSQGDHHAAGARSHVPKLGRAREEKASAAMKRSSRGHRLREHIGTHG